MTQYDSKESVDGKLNRTVKITKLRQVNNGSNFSMTFSL